MVPGSVSCRGQSGKVEFGFYHGVGKYSVAKIVQSICVHVSTVQCYKKLFPCFRNLAWCCFVIFENTNNVRQRTVFLINSENFLLSLSKWVRCSVTPACCMKEKNILSTYYICTKLTNTKHWGHYLSHSFGNKRSFEKSLTQSAILRDRRLHL